MSRSAIASTIVFVLRVFDNRQTAALVLPHQLRGLADRLIGSDQMGSFVLTSCAFVVVSSLRGCDDTYAARHRRQSPANEVAGMDTA